MRSQRPRAERPAQRLSVIVPVYNERNTVRTLLERVARAPLVQEIVVVDDGSTDGTAELLERVASVLPDEPPVVLARHARNLGKGAAVRTGLAQVTGDVVLVQDADLEYDPADYPAVAAPVLTGLADAGYGIRSWPARPRLKCAAHKTANRILSRLLSMSVGMRLHDVLVCYKVVRADLMRSLALEEDRFGFDAELTIRLAASGAIVHQTPISYMPRGFAAGKKIRFRDFMDVARILVRSLIRRRPVALSHGVPARES